MSLPHESTVGIAGPAGQVGRAGAIHDIGYRHYDGPRLGRAYIVRSLFGHGLRSAFGIGRTAKSKLFPFALLGAILLPALVLVAVTNVGNLDALPLPYAQYVMVTQAVIALFAAVAGPQLFSRDLRFNTIGLYFSRPPERPHYVGAKFLALTAAIAILTCLPLVILFVGALLAGLSVGSQVGDFILAVVGAILLSIVFAAIAALIASVTTRRGLGIAAIIGAFTLSFGVVNIIGGITGEVGNSSVSEYAGLFSPQTLVDGVQVWALGAESPSSALAAPSSTAVGSLYLAVLVAVVAGCLALLLLRYRKVSR